MLVYRIEDKNGRGAFYDLYCAHDVVARDEGLKSAFSHPGPRTGLEAGTELSEFFGEWRNSKEHLLFGCRSKPQLRMWFRSPKGRAAMAREGGVMVTYSVRDEHVKRGRYQVAFDRTKATKVSTVPADQW